MQTCSCRIRDWRSLRLALQLSTVQMAELLSVSRMTVWKLEHLSHHCPHRSSMTLLRAWLRSDTYRSRLQAAGYEYPWRGEDWEDWEDGA